MGRKMVNRILKFTVFTLAVTLLLLLLTSSPALAGNLVISPNSTALEVLPGTTARMVISVENGLGRSYSFNFSPAQLQNPPEGYSEFPDLSWINLTVDDTLLAPGERTWVTVEISIPDDERLPRQKWVPNPNTKWLLGFRLVSIRSGSSNPVSSKFADSKSSMIFSLRAQPGPVVRRRDAALDVAGEEHVPRSDR